VKAVIAGSNSSLGNKFARFFLEKKFSVTTASRREQLLDLDCPHVMGEVFEIDFRLLVDDDDVIIPCFGRVGIDFSASEKEQVLLVNFLYIAYLTKQLMTRRVPIMFPSTQRCTLLEQDREFCRVAKTIVQEVFGCLPVDSVDKNVLLEKSKNLFAENPMLHRHNIYDVSKYLAELSVLDFAAPGSRCLRIGNVYGRNVERGVVNRMMRAAFIKDDAHAPVKPVLELQRELGLISIDKLCNMLEFEILSGSPETKNRIVNCFPSEGVTAVGLLEFLEQAAIPVRKLCFKQDVNNQVFQSTGVGGQDESEGSLRCLLKDKLSDEDLYYYKTLDTKKERGFRLMQVLYRSLRDMSRKTGGALTDELCDMLAEFLYGVYVIDGTPNGEAFIYHSVSLAEVLLTRRPDVGVGVLVGALVHDVLEYSLVTDRQLAFYFGEVPLKMANLLAQNSYLKDVDIACAGLEVRFPYEVGFLVSIELLLTSEGKDFRKNILIKIEHYRRLLRSKNIDAIYLKVLDNCINYSIDCHSVNRKCRSKLELALFYRFFLDARVVGVELRTLLDEIEDDVKFLLRFWHLDFIDLLESVPSLIDQEVLEAEVS